MVKKLTLIVIILCSFFMCYAFAERLGPTMCNKDGYTCIVVQKGESWESLFPDANKRDIVMRVNRMNTRLYTGLKIAVPNNLGRENYMAESPFPQHTSSEEEHNAIVIKLGWQAFGAYNADGELVKWGPISAGHSWCEDVDRPCFTPVGSYIIYRKSDSDCVSSIYPITDGGGAPMPYCMFFHGGYALHGSPVLPGYHDSHGCIRMFTNDARWLNEEFIGINKTKVIIEAINKYIYFFVGPGPYKNV